MGKIWLMSIRLGGCTEKACSTPQCKELGPGLRCLRLHKCSDPSSISMFVALVRSRRCVKPQKYCTASVFPDHFIHNLRYLHSFSSMASNKASLKRAEDFVEFLNASPSGSIARRSLQKYVTLTYRYSLPCRPFGQATFGKGRFQTD